ncbi:hypothetical protein FO519_007421 [Halicephalobus sp. NKZ332]|nr:hypothetical protein FO519_007421 [Halicephalobus sp. NKZ332]
MFDFFGNMTSNSTTGILKTPSTFQPCHLDSESVSSKKSEKKEMPSETPPVIYYPQNPLGAVSESSSRKSCFNSHNLIGFIFFNLLAFALLFPLLTVSFVVYCIPEAASLHQNLIPGFNMTKIQLIGLFAFVCVDLLVYFLLYYTANYSIGFEGCSTGLHYKIFNGTQFIPMIIVMKLLQPLAVVGADGGETILFFALKMSIIFFFLLEVAVINLGSFSPITLDYPLILSVANLVFIYYSHQSIIVKYSILDLKKTAITQEYSCLDGQHCGNRFRANRLISYEATEKTFLLPSTVNYNIYSLSELPKWLKRAIRRRIATFH